MKYYHELWKKGPVRTEARRLAKEELIETYQKRGERFDLLSPVQQDNAVTVLLFNSEDVFLKRAKWSLGR